MKLFECATIHQHCFIVFVRGCKLPICQALKHLRTVVMFRRPWNKAPHLYTLSPHQTNLEGDSYPANLAELNNLPLELLNIIRRFSPHAALWRTISVLNLSRRSTPFPCQPVDGKNSAGIGNGIRGDSITRIFALESIQYWKRGYNQTMSLITISSVDTRPFIRLIIDSDGIQSIERLPTRPAFISQNSPHESYIVEDIATVSGVQVYIKVLYYTPE